MERSVVHIKEGEAVHDVTAKEAAVRDAKDKLIYELHADELNAEAADVLEYQALPE